MQRNNDTEKAIDNQIASARMEGLNITEAHRDLISKIVYGEISKLEAIKAIQAVNSMRSRLKYLSDKKFTSYQNESDPEMREYLLGKSHAYSAAIDILDISMSEAFHTDKTGKGGDK